MKNRTLTTLITTVLAAVLAGAAASAAQQQSWTVRSVQQTAWFVAGSFADKSSHRPVAFEYDCPGGARTGSMFLIYRSSDDARKQLIDQAPKCTLRSMTIAMTVTFN